MSQKNTAALFIFYDRKMLKGQSVKFFKCCEFFGFMFSGPVDFRSMNSNDVVTRKFIEKSMTNKGYSK